MSNMNKKAAELLNQIGRSDMLTTAYDTAWVARLGEIERNLGLPAIEWLCQNQLPTALGEQNNLIIIMIELYQHLVAMIALTYLENEEVTKSILKRDC